MCVCVQHGTEEVTSEEEEEEEMGEVEFFSFLTPIPGRAVLFGGRQPCVYSIRQDIEDLDHYEMKEEEPVDGKKSEDDGIEKENLAILEKIRKNQRQDHLNVSGSEGRGGAAGRWEGPHTPWGLCDIIVSMVRGVHVRPASLSRVPNSL